MRGCRRLRVPQKAQAHCGERRSPVRRARGTVWHCASGRAAGLASPAYDCARLFLVSSFSLSCFASSRKDAHESQANKFHAACIRLSLEQGRPRAWMRAQTCTRVPARADARVNKHLLSREAQDVPVSAPEETKFAITARRDCGSAQKLRSHLSTTEHAPCTEGGVSFFWLQTLRQPRKRLSNSSQ